MDLLHEQFSKIVFFIYLDSGFAGTSLNQHVNPLIISFPTEQLELIYEQYL